MNNFQLHPTAPIHSVNNLILASNAYSYSKLLLHLKTTVYLSNMLVHISLSNFPPMCHIGKVKLLLCLIKHQAMKPCKGMEVLIHAFLTSTLDRCAWSAPCPGSFTVREKGLVPIRQEAGWASEMVLTL